MESPGRSAIHPDVPDVTALVVNRLVELGGHSGVSAERFEILQQRTLYGSETGRSRSPCSCAAATMSARLALGSPSLLAMCWACLRMVSPLRNNRAPI